MQAFLDLLLKYWPILAAASGGFFALVTWWSVMLWRVSSGVTEVSATLKEHSQKHIEHAAKLDRLGVETQNHETRLTVLEHTITPGRQRAQSRPVGINP